MDKKTIYLLAFVVLTAYSAWTALRAPVIDDEILYIVSAAYWSDGVYFERENPPLVVAIYSQVLPENVKQSLREHYPLDSMIVYKDGYATFGNLYEPAVGEQKAGLWAALRLLRLFNVVLFTLLIFLAFRFTNEGIIVLSFFFLTSMLFLAMQDGYVTMTAALAYWAFKRSQFLGTVLGFIVLPATKSLGVAASLFLFAFDRRFLVLKLLALAVSLYLFFTPDNIVYSIGFYGNQAVRGANRLAYAFPFLIVFALDFINKQKVGLNGSMV